MLYRLITWESKWDESEPRQPTYIYLLERFLFFVMAPGVNQWGLEIAIKGSRHVRYWFIDGLYGDYTGGPLSRTRIALKLGRLVLEYRKIDDGHISRAFATVRIIRMVEKRFSDLFCFAQKSGKPVKSS